METIGAIATFVFTVSIVVGLGYAVGVDAESRTTHKCIREWKLHNAITEDSLRVVVDHSDCEWLYYVLSEPIETEK